MYSINGISYATVDLLVRAITDNLFFTDLTETMIEINQ